MANKVKVQPEELVLQLRHKVEWNGSTWTEMKLRAPRFGELTTARAEATGDMETVSLIESIARIERDAVELMDYRDLLRAHDYFTFFTNGPLHPERPAREVVQQGDTLVLTLRHVAELNGDKFTELALRPPRIGEVVKARRAPTPDASTTSLVAQITRIPLPALDLMDCRDIREADEYLGFFVAGAPPTPAS